MRHLYLFVGVLLFLSACQDGNEAQPLTGPVQSIADLPTDYQPIQNGSLIAGRLKSETSAGQLSGEWRYNQQGKLIEGRRYQNGQVATADQYRYDTNGRLRYVQHFDNECGYSSLSTCTGPVKWTSYDEIDLDNTGRIQESRTFLKLSGQWKLRSTTTYEYDSQNQPIKVARYDVAYNLIVTQALTYDSKGNVVSVRELNTGATPDLADRTFTYNYDQALNPYAGTVHYVSAFFTSRHLQRTANETYDYAANGYPIRIRQNNLITELSYY
ncbi:hypothetical protein [Spirosoma foliorum]|uniref:YD repeat-containing protein n=1 Tax=Spirosoma foliorum TaxID=2710596 RepID=A0A7G5GPN9_9BACT|nr:hypothetical protein [Spirosoma foliorum]QMW00831.1 hypothetical protein H3H32_22965 [Spirosoma foliorum]